MRNRFTAALMVTSLATSLLTLGAPAAHASSKGRRNVALGLGAIAAYELLRGKTRGDGARKARDPDLKVFRLRLGEEQHQELTGWVQDLAEEQGREPALVVYDLVKEAHAQLKKAAPATLPLEPRRRAG